MQMHLFYPKNISRLYINTWTIFWLFGRDLDVVHAGFSDNCGMLCKLP